MTDPEDARMPELPEVERARRLAQRHLQGKRITTVRTVSDDIVYDRVTPRQFAARLRGERVQGVHRRGKYIWLELERPPFPLFHFGMTGSFRVYHRPGERPRFWKVEIVAEDQTHLAMPNARRLGRIRLVDDPLRDPPLCRLGFDPLLDLPTRAWFQQALGRRRTAIKAVLLDQTFAAGVGNWIADEVLYQARIDPRRHAADLSPEETTRLRQKLRDVVRRAVAVDADKNRFPRSWLFHVRWGKNPEARTADGQRIRHIIVAGRTTAFVPTRQR
jgi:formamidopyrimidine-DNA glycosylase